VGTAVNDAGGEDAAGKVAVGEPIEPGGGLLPWLPSHVPNPTPTRAARPSTARAGHRPILAALPSYDKGAYLVLKYASTTGDPLRLPTIVVEPSIVCTTIW
jgi:hypothetical protein